MCRCTQIGVFTRQLITMRKDGHVVQQGFISHLEKQYVQSHSNMLVMRGVQHIHLGQYVWEGVEHIQYPRLCLAAMELQPLEGIRPEVHHVLPPRGFDQHSCARMNDNRVEFVLDLEVTQVGQLVCYETDRPCCRLPSYRPPHHSGCGASTPRPARLPVGPTHTMSNNQHAAT